MHPDTQTEMTESILDLLKRDHGKVTALLTEIEATEDEGQREEMFARLVGEIEAHAQAEEDVFYTTLEQERALEDRMEDARQEHDDVEHLLEEIDAISAADDEWLERLRELRQLFQHHIDEEEGELFTRAREVLDPGALARLGQAFLRAKRMVQVSVSGEQPAVTAGDTATPMTGGGTSPDTTARDVDRDDLEHMSKAELYRLARQRRLEGRSAMTKAELVQALRAS